MNNSLNPTSPIQNILNKGALLFAPMEGITDEYFRSFILKNYPEWDFVACDFLRIPTQGLFATKHLIEHFGSQNYQCPQSLHKTIYQILTSPNAQNEHHLELLNSLNINWLDLNLGCPSKTVCSHQGGSYLLSDLVALKKVLNSLRSHFKRHFTVKIRVGFECDKNFESIIKLINDCGVEAITIHGRTRTQLYQGVSNWEYIRQAAKWSQVPIIGNGDIWNPSAIDDFFEFTGCHALMLARGALKTPWIARWYKEKIKPPNPKEYLHLYLQELTLYLTSLYEVLNSNNLPPIIISKRLKSISRYFFDELPHSKQLKRHYLLSESPTQMIELIKNYSL